uniref:F-box domain-containing protein n=1 Tax=Macrostomum lignano TaxID=282301 RepID=A0A1I8GFW9_9PLAT
MQSRSSNCNSNADSSSLLLEAADSSGNRMMGLFELPDLVLDKIFSYLSYATISQLRPVSRQANQLCERRLNRGFYKLERTLQDSQRFVKAKLPRRESERKQHPFSRHSEILSAVDTRVSLLGMTYVKHMQFGRCCFIPGRVLDELFRILRTVRATVEPPRAHELLHELRDLSSMAMEHFEEQIEPLVKIDAAAAAAAASQHSLPVYAAVGSASAAQPACSHSHSSSSLLSLMAAAGDQRQLSRLAAAAAASATTAAPGAVAVSNSATAGPDAAAAANDDRQCVQRLLGEILSLKATVCSNSATVKQLRLNLASHERSSRQTINQLKTRIASLEQKLAAKSAVVEGGAETEAAAATSSSPNRKRCSTSATDGQQLAKTLLGKRRKKDCSTFPFSPHTSDRVTERRV